MTLLPRARARALAQHRDDRHTLAVPVALRLAARIQERPLERFLADPTQLSNGLREFHEAVHPDGLVVTDPEALAEDVASAVAPADTAAHPRAATAAEATRRLRATLGDGAALVAFLPGPASVARRRGSQNEGGEVVIALAKVFLPAGIDVVILVEEAGADTAGYEAPLRTVANMVRFHRGLSYLQGAAVPFLRAPSVVPLAHPTPTGGLVLTEQDLPPATSMTAVQEWVRKVQR